MTVAYDKNPRTYRREQAYAARLRAAIRGLLAVLVLLATALDELFTALVGLPAMTPRLWKLWQALADEYRAGAMGAVDADIVEDEEAR